MKKILLSLAIALCTAGAFAQTTHPAGDKKHDMKDMRKDVRDVRKDKAIRHREIKNGHMVAAHHTTRDIRSDKRDIHRNTRDLKRDGVK
ncbi:MAG: hypothetical protein KGM98_12865, partial [Bacteroidota bacterium]|nr:hypothetical protein [Bacteroidota bacterium]